MSFGFAASAGLNPYIALLTISILGWMGTITFAPPFDVLTDVRAMLLLVALYAVELLGQKVKKFRPVREAFYDLTRPIAGAVAFGAGNNTIAQIQPLVALACGLVIAGTVHKAQIRNGKSLKSPRPKKKNLSSSRSPNFFTAIARWIQTRQELATRTWARARGQDFFSAAIPVLVILAPLFIMIVLGIAILAFGAYFILMIWIEHTSDPQLD